MRHTRLRIVVLGLSLSSSWGNGHATTYRALLKSLAERGHEILFLERDVPWYVQNRDLTDPPYCRLRFYSRVEDLRWYRRSIAEADAVVVGSYVPDGQQVGEFVLATARGVTAFYDIDTPVTVSSLDAGTCTYLSRDQVGRYDLYFSFSGGPILQRLAGEFGAKAPRVLYCSVDADVYVPQARRPRWDLGYLGTYSADRQPSLERFLLEPAQRLPSHRFVIAGAQFPDTSGWPPNVDYIPHLAPNTHPRFYSSLRWALNVTRRDMVRVGFSPSVRLFEAAACGTPLISDYWAGLNTLFLPGREIVVAKTTRDVVRALTQADARRQDIGERARQRILGCQTSRQRAAEFEKHVLEERRKCRADLRKRGAGTDPGYLRFSKHACPRRSAAHQWSTSHGNRR